MARGEGQLLSDISIPGAVSVAAGVITWHRLQMQRPGYHQAVICVLNSVEPR